MKKFLLTIKSMRSDCQLAVSALAVPGTLTMIGQANSWGVQRRLEKEFNYFPTSHLPPIRGGN